MANLPITYLNKEDLNFIKKIGSGSFSSVWKVEWKRKERSDSSEDGLVQCTRHPIIAAAKVLNKIDTSELQFLSKLSHPHIVKLHGVVDKIPDFLLILEYCEHGSLDLYLENHVDEELHSCLLYSWCEQGARAIEYLHSIKVIHRDIKSGNFLITSTMNMKLCDFGISKNAGCTVTTKIKGTWGWTAPEIFQESHLSPYSDIFAFATVIWEMLTRKLPFAGLRFRDVKQRICGGERLPIPPGCPREIHDLISQCWEEDRKKRPNISSIIQVICKVRDTIFGKFSTEHLKKESPHS